MSAMQGEAADNTDAFDKRSSSASASMAGTLSMVEDYANNLTKALGTRPPYYTIGEITALDGSELFSAFGQNALGNMVRAVTSIGQSALSWLGVDTGYQEGVIIDGFGTVTGDIDIKFTENPVLFVSSSVSDGRFRTPNTVQMKIYVSNYYNDDAIGMGIDYLSSMDPTGGALTTFAKNVALYGGNTRAQQALYNLRKLQETGRPFTVYTPHGKYENMLIESLRPVTDDKNVDTLECDITFKEVIMYEVYKQNASSSIPARQNVGSDKTMVERLTGWSLR